MVGGRGAYLYVVDDMISENGCGATPGYLGSA
jgi:hypothetical protein